MSPFHVPQGPLRISGASPDLLRSIFTADFPRAVVAAPRVSALIRCDVPQADPVEVNSLAAQSFSVQVADRGITITAGGQAGLRYALVTLKPHLAGAILANPRAPRLLLERLAPLQTTQRPAFRTRGVMLDVSRDRIPTMDEFAHIIDHLADLKLNHLQLYTEHTFAYVNHREVWEGWSPITAEEVRTIDALCRSKGIELAANQNCFGHLAHWLRMPRYQHLAETHGDWMFDVWPRSGPFSLCPTDPRSIEFVAELLAELTSNFSSPLVNIGCDETYDIAFGRSAELVKQTSRAAVYLKFVEQICDVTAKLRRRPMFWADIALHEPACILQIPSELIGLAWGYEPHSPFAEWATNLKSAGRTVWACPGTSTWRAITGRSAERNANLHAAAVTHTIAADGYLLCDWGDTGHHQTWPVTLHALAAGAHAAWHGSLTSRDAIAASSQAIGSDALAAWLEALGDADAPLRQVAGRLSRPNQPGEFALWNQSALFADLHNCPWQDRPEVGALPAWYETRERLVHLQHTQPRHASNKLIDRECAHTIQTAIAACNRAIARRERPSSTSSRSVVAQQLTDLAAESAQLWHKRSRPGGLAHSQSFWRKAIAHTVELGSV